MLKDLYLALRVSPDASDDEIKKSFRRIAFRSHPDRNQERPDAEERFKEANFAYSILGNTEKRQRYDLYRDFMSTSVRFGLAPSKDQEKLIEDLFLNSSFPGFKQDFPWNLDTLAELHPLFDFSKTSVVFLNRIYKIVSQEESRDKSMFSRLRTVSSSVFREAGESFLPFVDRTQAHRKKKRKRFRDRSGQAPRNTAEPRQNGDIEWPLRLTDQEASHGTRATVTYTQDSKWKHLVVNVPPGVHDGMYLKVHNKGNRTSVMSSRGDLYLRISIS